MHLSDSRQALKGALLCSLLSALLLQVAVGLECYSYMGTFMGSVSLGEVPKVMCGPAQNVCAEGLIALGIGDQRVLVMMKKGCHAAQIRDLSIVPDWPYLPIYSHTRFCNASLCNHRYRDNSLIPAFPTAPPGNASASLLCYTCLGTTPESCSLRQAQQSRCYDDSPRCFGGTGTATIGGFAVPIYFRSCHAVGCVSITSWDPWLKIQLEGTSCCAQPLCNHAPEPAPTASPRPSHTASTRDRPANASPRPGLPLPTLLLLLLLGGWAWGAERAALGSEQGWRNPL
ncbi:ly6/PLAUR domain-containing protein 5 [Chelonia mydas]|uniref:ly6/PLAUR domain-containing protein 5 n=1 Tax=Chelonia mydas TaxID=8469 RepID=UPI0018A1C9CA|nr:ly6/PLAUR domain-containing protein 5 [Chelonia mydas]XP_043391387.1 ly6/PLAUR domain-containing protein 5 [Chelonia mydas]